MQPERRHVRAITIVFLAVTGVLLQACSVSDQQSGQKSEMSADTAASDATRSQTSDPVTAPTASEIANAVQPSDTPVGKQVADLSTRYKELRNALSSLQQSFQQQRDAGQTAIQDYRPLVTEIRSRLQLGTTPGNPELVSSWNEAQRQVANVSESAEQLGQLQQQLASQARSLDGFLNEVSDAFTLSGGLEQDHANLARLQDAGRQMMGEMTSLQQKLNRAISSRRRFVEIARADLRSLAQDIRGDVAQRTQ